MPEEETEERKKILSRHPRLAITLARRETVVPRGPVRTKAINLMADMGEDFRNPEVQAAIGESVLVNTLIFAVSEAIQQGVRPTIRKNIRERLGVIREERRREG